MTRQAAFKRFGKPVDPATGKTLQTRGIDQVRERTEQVFALIAAGDYEGLAEILHPATAQELSPELIAETWRRVLGDVGELQQCRDTRVELPGGEVIADDDRVIGTVIGATTLECEAGVAVGRVALDEDAKVVGILLLPENHGPLPF